MKWLKKKAMKFNTKILNAILFFISRKHKVGFTHTVDLLIQIRLA